MRLTEKDTTERHTTSKIRERSASADKAVDYSTSWSNSDFEFGVSNQTGWAEVLLASGAEILLIPGAVPFSYVSVFMLPLFVKQRATGVMEQLQSKKTKSISW